MKLMNSLTRLTLSAALVPIMTMGAFALASDHSDSDVEVDQEQSDQMSSSAQGFLAGMPVGALYGDDIIGQSVMHRGTNEVIGQIEDLIIGEDGRLVGVIVTTGGVLGLGGQEVSLNWDQLDHSMEDDDHVFYIDMDEEALRNAPEHRRD